MGFIRDKVIAPIAGHVAKHTPPEVGTKAIEAAGTNRMAETMGKYLGPEASVKMMDTAGPEHLADILGPKDMATFLTDTLRLGNPQSQQLLLAIGPHRMAMMLTRLGLSGAVRSVNTLGPANAAAVTIMELGPQNGAQMFRAMGATFSAGLLSGLGPWFAGTMLKAPGSAVVGEMMGHMEPGFAASMFQTTGANFLGLMYQELGAPYAGAMMAAAGVPWLTALFRCLGPHYLADFMQTTGPEYQAHMLRALGLENSAKVFEGCGAEFMAELLQAVGPQFNAILMTQLGGKGAMILGLDLGAGFLAEVGSHASPGFLASLVSATAGEVVGPVVTAAKQTLLGDHHQDDYHPERHQHTLPATPVDTAGGYAPGAASSSLNSVQDRFNSLAVSSTGNTQPVTVRAVGDTISAGAGSSSGPGQLPHRGVGLGNLIAASDDGQKHVHRHEHEHHKVVGGNLGGPAHGVHDTPANYAAAVAGPVASEGAQRQSLMNVADASALQDSKLQSTTHAQALAAAPAGVHISR